MKFSEKWLRQWVNPNVDINTLSEALSMAGLEVEAIQPIGTGLNNVFVGEILSAEPHPDADRLRVCKVNVGHGEPLNIVCGAANARSGIKVAVATINAVLPGDFKIKKAKIRGIESFGMICSSSELALTESSEGIMELPMDAPVGQTFAEYLNLPDHSIDVSLTPNRGDCLSIQGMAREVSAVFQTPLTPPHFKEIPAQTEHTFPVNLLSPVDCPRYAGRVIHGINPKAITPLWMTEYLRRSGLRSIHPVVDVVNYVMLELGQPMHAFDLSTLNDEIQIRQGKLEEKVTLLDQQTITLDKPALVISDTQKILALAGIMGGQSSSVTDQTTDIFLESAFFTPEAITPSTRHHPIQSDSSHRFERGVDPQLCVIALHRATELLLAITGGQPGQIIDKKDATYFPKPCIIKLRKARIQRILGIALDTTTVENIFHRLDMKIQAIEDGWEVTVPSYRFDLHLEIDLIEELARIHGYHQIPNNIMIAPLKMFPVPEEKLSQKRIRNLLTDHGYYESINYSFIQPKYSELLNPKQKPIALSNPISAEMSVMRTSLWPGLIQAALFNLNRQQPRLRLFEIGVCFLKEGEDLSQPSMLGGIVLGSAAPKQWGESKRLVDFFDLKGDLESLFSLTQTKDDFVFLENTHPALHPGRSADIYKNDQLIGHAGALHPNLQLTFGLQVPVYLFELTLSALEKTRLPAYEAPSKYPSIRRDLAFIVEKKLPYQRIHDIIQSSAGNTLKNLQLFDIYEGENIGEGKKSIALELTFQLNSRTLTDKEIDQTIANIINTLKQDFKATLRE